MLGTGTYTTQASTYHAKDTAQNDVSNPEPDRRNEKIIQIRIRIPLKFKMRHTKKIREFQNQLTEDSAPREVMKKDICSMMTYLICGPSVS
jgi:hypothetical protein